MVCCRRQIKAGLAARRVRLHTPSASMRGCVCPGTGLTPIGAPISVSPCGGQTPLEGVRKRLGTLSSLQAPPSGHASRAESFPHPNISDILCHPSCHTSRHLSALPCPHLCLRCCRPARAGSARAWRPPPPTSLQQRVPLPLARGRKRRRQLAAALALRAARAYGGARGVCWGGCGLWLWTMLVRQGPRERR